MSEFLPVVVVFVIGFVGYLGKIGVSGALARRKMRLQDWASMTAMLCDDEIPEIRHTGNDLLRDNDRRKELAKCNERWYTPLLEEDIPYSTEPKPEEPDEENIFQATEEDLAWCAKMLQERYKLKDRNVRLSLPKFFKPEDGATHTIRILPPFVAAQTPNSPLRQSKLFATAQQHYIDSSNGDVLQCGRSRSVGKWVGECPICDHYEFLNRDPTATIKHASKFKPFERFYYNVGVIGEGKSLPRIWSVSRTTHEKIQQEISESGDDISNLMTGRNIKVTRDINRSRPVVQVEFDKDPSMMSRKNIQNWLDNLCNLKGYVASQTKTQEQLECAVRRASFHFCQSGSLRVGNWVYWETKAGTISVRPSIVYKIQNGVKNGKFQQLVMLKYKRYEEWSSFWVTTTKCKLLSFDGHQSYLLADHVKKMYEDFSAS